jgi:hypothetical protein
MKKGNGPLWLTGWASRVSFFSFFFSFSFYLFFHLLCYGVASSMDMGSICITLPHLITFNEESTTRHLKKSKESRGEDSSCN